MGIFGINKIIFSFCQFFEKLLTFYVGNFKISNLEVRKIEPWPRTYKCINSKLVKHYDNKNVVIIVVIFIQFC
jgi:hypothetical protein